MTKRFSGIKTLCILLLTATSAWGQVTTIADGDWNDTNTWSSGTIPDNTFGAITVDHAVVIPAGYSVTIDQTTITPNGVLTIDAGGTLTVANAATDLVINGQVDVNGTLVNNNSVLIAGTDGNNLIFGPGSVFRWLFETAEGTLPLASWDAESTLLITGYANNSALNFASANWGQQFGNVIWNCPAANQNINLNGLLTDIQGDLSIVATGTATRLLTFSSTGSVNLNIGGSFSISGTSRVQFTTTGTAEFNIGGDFNFTSTQASGSTGATTGSVTMTVGGNFIMNASGGRLRFGTGTSAGVNVLNLGGDFTLGAGTTLDETATNAVIQVNFNEGGNAIHNFLNNGTINGCMQYYVGPDDVLDLGTSFIIGSNGTAVTTGLTLDGTVRVGSLDASGAIRTGSSAANIRIPTDGYRIYNPNSTIVYAGAAAQFLGAGHPTGTDINVAIDNPSGVTTATTNVTIDGDLVLLNGNLNINSVSNTRTLSLGGNVTANGNFITFTGTASVLTIYGDGDFGTFPFTNMAQTIRDFTLNRTGSVTFGEQVTITGAVNLQAGDLIFDGQTLNLSGTFSSTGGFLSSDNASILNITGNGALGSLVFAIGGNTLNTLTFNRTSGGTATLDGTLTISNALTLNNGSFTNNAGLIMGNGATLTRNSAASLLANRPSSPNGDVYNVIYTGTALTTGLELPDPLETDDDLNNLTISGGPVSLGQNLFVNGNVNLNNSTFNAQTFTITMEGAQWNDNAGNFNAGTGTVVFGSPSGTVVGGSSVPTFGHIQLNSGSSLTFPSGNVLISGDIQFNAGGTFNANGGTITLNAAINQTVAGAGMTINNLTLSKPSSSDVTLTSPLSMTGALTITSSNTDFASGGLLTLISTSDGAEGNASIQSLLNGATVSGSVTVQRFMSSEGRIYRYISSPVTNAAVSQLQDDFPVTGNFTGTSVCGSCSTNTSMYAYIGATSTYVAFPTASNTETLTPGTGYSPFIRQDVVGGPITLDFTGPINQGPVSLTVGHNGAAAESWNLVGNPYPASIDWDIIAGWTKSNIATQISVRDNGVGGVYLYWDGATGGLTNGEIAAAQGFWVRTIGGSPVLTVNENAKTPATGTFYREEKMIPDVLVINVAHLSNKKIADRAYIRVRPDAAAEYELLDVPKLPNDNFDLSSRTSNGKRVAINAVKSLGCGSQIVLDLHFPKTANGNYVSSPLGSYTLSLDQFGKVEGLDVTLIDRFTSASTVLREGDAYNFNITSDARSIAPDRFTIAFSENAPKSVTLSAPAAVCDNSETSVNIEGAAPYVTYQLLYKGNVLKEISGAEMHTVSLNSNILEDAENVIEVTALGSCGTVFPAGQVILNKAVLVTASAAATSAVCGSGKVTLKAYGNSTVDYNWYDMPDAAIAVAEATDVYETPSLNKSKAYYVAAVSEEGCEGPRAQVLAEVTPAEPISLAIDVDELITDQTGTLEWYKDDQKIDGVSGSRFKPENSGYYSVAKVNNTCRSVTPKVYFEYIERGGLPYGVVLYPNPMQHSLRLNYPANAKLKRAALYNNTGVMLSEFTLSVTDGKINGELDVRNLPVGIYIVKIFGEKEVVAVKVVKE